MLMDLITGQLYQSTDIKLNFEQMIWEKVPNQVQVLTEISEGEAVKRFQQTKYKIKIPIGVIGSGKPTDAQYQIATHIGEELASLGLAVICGGRAGIMEAVCKGVQNKNGLSIGLLPEVGIENANKYVSLPLATGVGFARNAIIAASSFCLIAIGGGNGTLSEIAYGLQFGKPVFTIDSNLIVDGVRMCQTVSDLTTSICKLILKL